MYKLNEDYLVSVARSETTSFFEEVNSTYPTNNNYYFTPNNNQQNKEIILIDRVTGRPMPGRRLGEGLHEALEAKEGLAIKPPTEVIATISLHSYFKQYKKLAGLSGTLETDNAILYGLYGLETIVIPTHKPVQRIEGPTLVFRTQKAASRQLLEASIKVRESGAPVLIGTPSVRISEEISGQLSKFGIPHQILNARQTEHEASIIARAGYPGRITIATNMAGRGTDISLGANYEDHLEDLAKHKGLVREADEGTPAWLRLEEEARARVRRAKEIVYRAGGLHVLELGLQSSRRLDRQLIGRAGRQGDPGYSQFFYSLEDELVVQYAAGSGAYKRLVEAGYPENIDRDEAINSALALKLVEECQTKAEGQHLDILKLGIEYDSVLNLQRELFYQDRQTFLYASAEELKTKIGVLISNTSGESEKGEPSENLNQFWNLYSVAERRLDKNKLVELVREVILSTLDRAWIGYLTPLEELRQGISFRMYGGQNPLQSYKIEAYRLWETFQSVLRHELLIKITNKLQEAIPL